MFIPVNTAVRVLIGAVALAFAAGALAQAKPLTKSTLRLDWKPGGQHGPFYYAKEKGYYAAEGIDLQIIPGSGSSDSVKQVGSKAVDFALVDALVLVQGAEQRVPVKAVAVYYERSPIVLMSPKAKPITDVKQLLGDVKLGSKKGSATYQGLVALLFVVGATEHHCQRQAGMAPDDAGILVDLHRELAGWRNH